jgi:hypothetical protein
MNNSCPQCKGKCCRNIDSGYRVLHMAAQVYMHDCDYCDEGTEIKPEYDALDNPEHDGTDLAHPAWWRGCDSGADSTVVIIHQMLDDIEAGKEKTGTFGSQKLNMLRDRLYQMYGK